MIRRILPLAAALALAVLAVGLVAVAVRVWQWPVHSAGQDALLLRRPVPERAWVGDGGLAADLLGAKDDVAFRSAVGFFLRSRADDAGGNKTIDQIVASVEATIRLTEIQRGDGPSARRSTAANLEGILLGEDALFELDGAPRLRRAIDLLRRAICLDPANDAAKANLEIMLGLVGESGIDSVQTGGFGGFGKEAGAGLGGSGY